MRELSDTCGLSIGTVHKILHEDLHMKKLAARWVPHLLTDEQKKNGGLIVHVIYLNLLSRMDQNGCMMWSPGMKLGSHFMAFPTNVATVRGWVLAETDQLFYDQVFRAESDYLPFFFNSSGLVALDILPEKTTVTAKYYTEVVLPKVEDSICEQRPTIKTSKTLLLHDNAAPHKAKLTTTYLNERGISVLEHPPYSPDLAPCDFWLFPILKNRLAGRKFDRAQDLAKAVKLELLSIPKEQYQRAFQSWLRRLEKCVQVQGEYFEGM